MSGSPRLTPLEYQTLYSGSLTACNCLASPTLNFSLPLSTTSPICLPLCDHKILTSALHHNPPTPSKHLSSATNVYSSRSELLTAAFDDFTSLLASMRPEDPDIRAAPQPTNALKTSLLRDQRLLQEAYLPTLLLLFDQATKTLPPLREFQILPPFREFQTLPQFRGCQTLPLFRGCLTLPLLRG
jgi:hypothetical protein